MIADPGVLEHITKRLLINSEYDMRSAFERALHAVTPFCESAIEAMLIAALDFTCHLSAWHGVGTPIRYVHASKFDQSRADFTGITIVPQYEWEGLRIDFALFVPELNAPLLFIECDGHEFHERTAGQAERDRKKDRKIQQASLPIVRFTGREINRDPFACADEILKFAMALEVDAK